MADLATTALGEELGRRLGEILDAWANRNELKAVKLADSLGFWRDGMLDNLQKIADGELEPNKDTVFLKLGEQFRETKEPVERIITELSALRTRLEGRKGAAAAIGQIDVILYHKDLGKNRVRKRIQYILAHKDSPYVQEEAKAACNDIRGLNAEIAKLSRLVHGS